MRGSFPVRIAPLTPELAGAWAALFDASGSACFCRWWHFEGNKNDWLARCFHEPARNREEQTALVAARAPEAGGLVAFDEGGDGNGNEIIGWMKLAPRARLTKLRRQGAYRALDLGDDEGVWSVGCLLVRPDRRRRGVARALVEAAPDRVKVLGGRAVEAYPHHVAHALHDEEAWMGPESVFVGLGWQEWLEPQSGRERERDAAPYPIYRKAV
jgi:GNAT superfamily N-acetyltransferase